MFCETILYKLRLLAQLSLHSQGVLNMPNKIDHLSQTAFIGVGGCGVEMIKAWKNWLPDEVLCIAVDRNTQAPKTSSTFEHQIMLSNIKSMGATIEYTDSTRAEIQTSLDSRMPELTAMLQGKNNIVLLAGLGGVVGTWATQLICNQLVAMNKHVATLLVMPFAFESEPLKVAEHALLGFSKDATQELLFNDETTRNIQSNTSLASAISAMTKKAFLNHLQLPLEPANIAPV